MEVVQARKTRGGPQPPAEERMTTTVALAVRQINKLRVLASREDLTQGQLIRRAVDKLIAESGL